MVQGCALLWISPGCALSCHCLLPTGASLSSVFSPCFAQVSSLVERHSFSCHPIIFHELHGDFDPFVV
ncbi:hypothetical protein DAI22_03g029900 [Oryza sativa Japonica Group]|nr:hypothetical protein DAI22_03g029900 [Oryza sativa Japonica Group]